MGLPDVKVPQAALMGYIEQQMRRAADQFAPDAMLETIKKCVFPALA